MFTSPWAQLSRHLHLEPEVVALDANRKFLRRFAALEALAAQRGVDLTTATKELFADLWHCVKTAEGLDAAPIGRR